MENHHYLKDARMRPSPIISLICPLYNEEDSLIPFFSRLIPVLRQLGEPCEIICIDDGSQDQTLNQLLQIQIQQEEMLTLVVHELTRNFGKEAALTAGLDMARGEAVIPIDVDLQDPPELIAEMVTLWRRGYDVVLARREDRSSDSWLKRNTAQWFYWMYNKIADIPLPENAGDFRLMDRRVVEAIKLMPERQRFMKGLFVWVGFRSTSIYYVRGTRSAGSSKFNGWRLWNFALEGITSHSTAPLRIWSYFGASIAALSFIYGNFIILRTLIYGVDLPGYASLLTVILFLGGIQLIGLGVLGEYLGRTYMETKQRPVYLLRKTYYHSLNQSDNKSDMSHELGQHGPASERN